MSNNLKKKRSSNVKIIAPLLANDDFKQLHRKFVNQLSEAGVDSTSVTTDLEGGKYKVTLGKGETSIIFERVKGKTVCRIEGSDSSTETEKMTNALTASLVGINIRSNDLTISGNNSEIQDSLIKKAKQVEKQRLTHNVKVVTPLATNKEFKQLHREFVKQISKAGMDSTSIATDLEGGKFKVTLGNGDTSVVFERVGKKTVLSIEGTSSLKDAEVIASTLIDSMGSNSRVWDMDANEISRDNSNMRDLLVEKSKNFEDTRSLGPELPQSSTLVFSSKQKRDKKTDDSATPGPDATHKPSGLKP